jgi:hypothetical protein
MLGRFAPSMGRYEIIEASEEERAALKKAGYVLK